MLNSRYLVRLLEDPQTVRDLRAYYGTEDGNAGGHAGRWFDLLVPNEPNRVTATDLVAAQCLGVTVPVKPSIDLLEGALGAELGALLRAVPTDVDLGSGDAISEIGDGSPADLAWRLLAGYEGVSRAAASTLLARKRPRLVPVWDQVVRCALGRPLVGGVWESIDRVVRKANGTVTDRLARLHRDAGLGPYVADLRVLDVAAWMRHRPSHQPQGCPGGLGY